MALPSLLPAPESCPSKRGPFVTRTFLPPPIPQVVTSLYIPILECLSMGDVLGKFLILSQPFRFRPGLVTESQLFVYSIYPRNYFLLHIFWAILRYITPI